MAKNYEIRPTYIVELDHRLSEEAIDRAVQAVAEEHSLLLRRAVGMSEKGREVPVVEFYDYDFDLWLRRGEEVSESREMTKGRLSALLQEVLQSELRQLVEEERKGFWSVLRAV